MIFGYSDIKLQMHWAMPLSFPGHVTSMVMWPFESHCVIYCGCAIDTNPLSWTVFEINKMYLGRDIISHMTDSLAAADRRLNWTSIIGCQSMLEKCFNGPTDTKPFRYITGRLSSIPPGYVNRVPASAGVKAGVHFCQVLGNTVWSHMASDTP